jgi:putative transcriptional regulator
MPGFRRVGRQPPSRGGCVIQRGVAALLLLVAVAWPAVAQEPPPLTAIVLTARADLPDPDFRDAVVLVFNNIGPTPMGVIINRPTAIEVARLFPEVAGLGSIVDKVYFGGPVSPTTVSFLFRSPAPPAQHVVRVLDDLYLGTDLGLLRDLLTRDRPMEDLKIFIGYAGWAPGQLEMEIARGDWKLGPADAGTAFQGRPEHPWPAERIPYGGRRA